MLKPHAFNVAAFVGNQQASALQLGTLQAVDAQAVVAAMKQIHACGQPLDLLIFPLDGCYLPALQWDGTPYPIFLYRPGVEGVLTPQQFDELLSAWLDGKHAAGNDGALHTVEDYSMSVNEAIIVGNICKQPKVGYFTDGGCYANFQVASNERFSDGKGGKRELTEYHNIVTKGLVAEFVRDHLEAGQLLYVRGRLSTRSWEDDKGGPRRYITEIVVKELRPLGPSTRGENSDNQE